MNRNTVTKFNSNKAFNSSKQQARKFNASRYASAEKQEREIFRLFAPRGTNMEGFSQLNSDPYYTRFENKKRFAQHLLYGCQGKPIRGKTNEDGSQARRCDNPECGGRWQGFVDSEGKIDPTKIGGLTRRAAQLAGIFKDENNVIHHAGDNCRDKAHHFDRGLVGSEPTVGDYASLMVRVPGEENPIQVQHLLTDPTRIIGNDEHGTPIRVGHYMKDKRVCANTGESRGNRQELEQSNDTCQSCGNCSGKPVLDTAYLHATHAYENVSEVTRKLMEDGVTDPKRHFQAIGGQLRRAFKTKRKEFDRNDTNGEEYVSIMKGAPEREAAHTVLGGTLRNIRETLGDDALVGNDPGQRKMWDMMKTPDITLTSNPQHLLNHSENPLECFFDVQHATEAFKSKDPGVSASAFAAYPQDIPGVGNMADLGNVAKKDPLSSWWRTKWRNSFFKQGFRSYQENKNPLKVETEHYTNAGFKPDEDETLFHEMGQRPEAYVQPGFDEIS